MSIEYSDWSRTLITIDSLPEDIQNIVVETIRDYSDNKEDFADEDFEIIYKENDESDYNGTLDNSRENQLKRQRNQSSEVCDPTIHTMRQQPNDDCDHSTSDDYAQLL